MLFYDRSDGQRIRNLRAFTAILPYVMRTRSEAAILFSKDVDVEAAMSYVRRRNAEADSVQSAGAGRYSLFGLLIAAAVRTIVLKPRLNRFVHRRAFYQRKDISVSFLVKKALTEAATEGNAKIRFEKDEGLAAAVGKIHAGIEAARSGAPGRDDKEFSLAHRLPFGKAFMTILFRLLDRFNAAPAKMIEADPLFTSLYAANLGSIGLDTPYHHLYAWGTASVYMVVGRVFQKETRKPGGSSPAGGSTRAELRHHVNVKFTVDERIAEGIYFAHAAALFQRLVSDPESLELPPDLSDVED